MARPDVSAAQVEALTTEFTEIVTTRGGDVVYNEYWGLRPTAYRIKKNRKAHYVLMHISAGSDAMDEMHRIMGLNEDVLRTLTTRVEAFEETPTIQMRQKSRDGSRVIAVLAAMVTVHSVKTVATVLARATMVKPLRLIAPNKI